MSTDDIPGSAEPRAYAHGAAAEAARPAEVTAVPEPVAHPPGCHWDVDECRWICGHGCSLTTH